MNTTLKTKPPEKYKEGVLTVEEGMDNIPELIDYINAGYTKYEAEKMNLLVRIELMREQLIKVNLNEVADKEIRDFTRKIEGLINEYNEL